ncbi:alanyl (membrane) aminopeptidase a [Nematolebias whitei]|uniref:alanyl (membrane) aminopeptidase a n=1 Tax=Nematolebias whitei TaxID=451745 RepID=UPI0018994DB3|nr:alanyl (membrane) aminopeptidase a [Nematolebias whitei]
MPRKVVLSKGFAVAFAVLTVSAIAGMITMLTVYKIEIGNMNVTRPPTVPSTTMAPPPVMRLPRNLIPESYKIFIQPHIYTRIVEVVNVTTPNQTLLFTGNSTVNLYCVQGTRRIYLHSRDLVVSSPIVTNRNTGETIGIATFTPFADEKDFLEIELEENLRAGGNYSLFLAFQGDISENLETLYLSKYTEVDRDSENETIAERFLVATNLEPTNARSLFPCFDEPDMKAVFTLTVIHRPETTALSNSEAEKKNQFIDDEWVYTQFRSSPKMSSYLLAFTVSEFKTLSPSRDYIKVYARPEAVEAGHAKYATEITPKILTFYENLFDLELRPKKLHQIALPDLEPLAMENWGLITYQEGVLLYEEGVSSLLHKEEIIFTIAHELAHQWFGNMVTMKWWNDLWLKEGFSSYMSYLAVDHAEPTFQIKDTLIMNDLHTAFEEDALTSSHPLSAPMDQVQTQSQIYEMFDAITYCKGAIVLRMLVDFVGEQVFTKGIRQYLNEFNGQNAEPSDFWKYINFVRQEKGEVTIDRFMIDWTTQTGYPVITINTTSGEIYQKRFLYNSSAQSDGSWLIHIHYMSSIAPPESLWLDVSGPVRLEPFISKKGEWILVNVNCTGYYRVNYNPENWHRLLTQLETDPDRIPLMNRGQLIDDAFNLARAKQVSVTLALNSTRFLHNEIAYLPWESAIRNLEYFILMFDRSEVYGPMQVYLREQVRGLYNFFRNYTDNSTVPENHSLQHNQILAISVACAHGLPECIAMATEQFAGWMKSNSTETNNIHTNLRSVIYCQAVAAGDKKEWEFAWEKFLNSSNTSEKEQLRKALACSKKTWLLNRYLEYTLDPKKIRLMDVASTINYIAQNAAGQALAWNFIRANWKYVSQGGPAGLLEGVTSRFSTPFELAELTHFINSEIDGALMTGQRAIEQTQVNIQWVSENKAIILEWFERETAHLE